MVKLSEKIQSLKLESVPRSLTPGRVGDILESLMIQKVTYFRSVVDPTLLPDTDVKDGDIWFYPVAPFMKYERIGNDWVEFNSTLTSTFRPDGIFDCDTRAFPPMWFIDANRYDFLSELDYNVLDCND